MFFLSLSQNGCSCTLGGFINPLKELTDTSGALEIEAVWVVDRVGGSQDQGLVAFTSETCRIYPVVVGVGLFLHTFQVLVDFLSPTCHIALGEKSMSGTSIIFPIGSVLLFDHIPFQGYTAPGAMGFG